MNKQKIIIPKFLHSTPRIRKLLIVVFFLFFSQQIFSQFYQTGTDPGNIKWEQINTTHFKIVFPDNFQEKANEMANILEYYYPKASFSLQHKPQKIPVLLHTHTVNSNGFVVWAPKRIELNAVPPQNIYAVPWFQQLAIHEFRHVVQLDKLEKGIPRILRYLSGQSITGAVAGFLPLWVYEGDAVVTETLLTNSGRGRIPGFKMGIRTNSINDIRYSYEKSVFGSYKDHVPDFYAYGYLMSSFARKMYGSDFWPSVFDHVAAKPYDIPPFYKVLKKRYNTSKVELYKQTMDHHDSLWRTRDKKNALTSYITWSKPPAKDYTSFRFPQYIDSNSVICEKSGIDQVKQFIMLNKDGTEKMLFTPGFYSSVTLSYADNKIVWSETQPDMRWEKRNYAVIKLFDIEKGQVKQLTSKSRYFAPDLNPDGSEIVTVNINDKNEIALLIIDTETGYIKKHIPSPGNFELQLPRWSEDGKSLVMTRLTNEGKSIVVYNLEEDAWQTVVSSTYTDVSQPRIFKNYIFFTGAYTGINNIYAIHTENGKLWQVTSSRFGAYDPEPNANNETMIYSDYTSRGYKLVEIQLDTNSWNEMNDKDGYTTEMVNYISLQEKAQNINMEIPENKYEIRAYKRISHLFKFHSWIPFYADYQNFNITDPSIDPGLMLFSQNLLGTAVSSVSWSYRNGGHYLNTKFIYRGFLPVFEIDMDYGGKPLIYRTNEEQTLPHLKNNKKEFSVNSYIPLNLSNGRNIIGLRPGINVLYKDIYVPDKSARAYSRGLIDVDYRLLFYWQLKQSYRDIIPPWGLVSELNYKTSPFETLNFGTFFYMVNTIFLHGLSNHHGVRIKHGLQRNIPERYYYSANLSFPRGYRKYISEKYEFLKINYIMPLFYPDWRMGSLLFIKRFRSNFFYDFAYGQNVIVPGDRQVEFVNRSFSSSGIELITDLHIAQFLFPFSIGGRISYLFDKDKFNPELIFQMDISGY